MPKNGNLIYILDCNGNQLPPTRRGGKVRKLLDNGQAVIVKKDPFTIKLKYDCNRVQDETHVQTINKTDVSAINDIDYHDNKGDNKMSIKNTNNNQEQLVDGSTLKRNSIEFTQEITKALEPLETSDVDTTDGITKQKIYFNQCRSQMERYAFVIEDIIRHIADYAAPSNEHMYRKMFQENKAPIQRKFPKDNNYIQNSVLPLIKAITHSFADSTAIENKALSILSIMKIRADISGERQQDFKPYVFALLNIHGYINGLDDIVAVTANNYDRAHFASNSNIEQELAKYGHKAPLSDYMFKLVTDWIWCCCEAEDGLYRSIQAAYSLIVSIASYSSKIGSYKISPIVNYVVDEYQQRAYKPIVMCSAVMNGFDVTAQHYANYLKWCGVNEDLTMSDATFESLIAMVESVFNTDRNHYNFNPLIRKAKKAFVAYRVVNKIDLNAPIKNLPEEVIENINSFDEESECFFF